MALAAAPGRRRSARLQGLPDEPGPSGRPAVPPGDGLQVPAAGTGAGTDHQGGKKRGRKAAAEAERAGARAENQKPFKKQRGARQPGAGPTRAAEQALWEEGYMAVGGLDEAGRGPLAGPVVAAVCVLPRDAALPPGLNDSKLVRTEEEREQLYAALTSTEGVQWATCIMDHATIDRLNILQATMAAMRGAALQLRQLDYLLVDGNRVPQDLPVPAKAIVRGDGSCSCIAAASVIAKVTRDRLMVALDKEHPNYGFAQHKGYGVPQHFAAIQAHGPCEVHRRSFQPIRGICKWTRPKANQAAPEEAAQGAGEAGVGAQLLEAA